MRAPSWQSVHAAQTKALSLQSPFSVSVDGKVAQLMAIRSAEGILSLLTDELFLLGRDAHWRDQPISDRQVAFLSNLIATSLPLDKSSASASTISGDWVGQPSTQVPLGHLTAGQASDTLERVLRGREKLEEQFKEQGKLRPVLQWFGAEVGSKEARKARLKQSKELDAALRKYYFA